MDSYKLGQINMLASTGHDLLSIAAISGVDSVEIREILSGAGYCLSCMDISAFDEVEAVIAQEEKKKDAEPVQKASATDSGTNRASRTKASPSAI